MARVTFEFDENDDREDINIIVNRYKLLGALNAVSELRGSIYNNKIYDKDALITVKDGKVLTAEDYDRFQEAGEYPVEDTKEYISSSYIESRLGEALEHIYDLLDY